MTIIWKKNWQNRNTISYDETNHKGKATYIGISNVCVTGVYHRLASFVSTSDGALKNSLKVGISIVLEVRNVCLHPSLSIAKSSRLKVAGLNINT